MLVSNTTYFILIILFFLAIVIIAGILAQKIKANKTQLKILFILTPVICIGLNMLFARTFPSIYTIIDCGKYNKQIMLFSTRLVNGQALTMGNHAYIDNQSRSILHLKTIRYGDPLFEDNADTRILPHESLELPVNRIDYLFETPPESITTKGSGVVKQYLYCE